MTSGQTGRALERARMSSLGTLSAVAALILAGVAVLPAQDAPDRIGEVTLFGEEEIMVQVATKTEIPISKAPGAVTVISAQQIRESQARTIPEILRLVAGVNVRWNPMVQTIDIRSFGQNPFTSRILLLIDGVPYNDWNKGGFPQHPGFDFFSLQNVKRIEVVRGPGSALYGENAYWGVVNIVTLSGDDLEGGRVELYGGDLETRSLNAMYGTRVGDDGSFLISAKLTNGQFPTAFWFEENDAEVETGTLFLKAGYKGLELSYYRYEDSADGFVEPIPIPGLPPSVFQSIDAIEQTVDIAAAKYSKRWDNGTSFGGDVSFAQRDGSHCAACHASSERPEFRDTESDHGYQVIGDFRLGVHDLPHHDLLFGAEVRRIDAGDHEDELLQPGVGLEHDVVTAYNKIAAYVQDVMSFADGDLNVILGARYDGSTDLFESEVSPRAAIVYTPSERAVVRAGWSTAFRFPNFSELYQSSGFLVLDNAFFSTPLAVFAPNPGLEREEIRSFELGFEYRLIPALSAKLDLYQSEVRDFIVVATGFPPQPQPSFLRFENHPDDATIRGGELEFRFAAGRKATGFVGWAYQDQEQAGSLVDSVGLPFEFAYAPANKLTFGGYFGPFAGLRFSIESQWRDDHVAPSSWTIIRSNFSEFGAFPLDSYGLVNARLSYDVPVRIGGSSEGLRLSLYGKNLTDEEPEETVTGVDGRIAGRQFFGSLELRF